MNTESRVVQRPVEWAEEKLFDALEDLLFDFGLKSISRFVGGASGRCYALLFGQRNKVSKFLCRSIHSKFSARHQIHS